MSDELYSNKIEYSLKVDGKYYKQRARKPLPMQSVVG